MKTRENLRLKETSVGEEEEKKKKTKPYSCIYSWLCMLRKDSHHEHESIRYNQDKEWILIK